MWECNFAEERMDYKLFWLRFVKKIWLILAATALGAVLVGVPYYFVNVTLGEGPAYRIVSEYYLDYAEDSSGAVYDYFNYYTWSEIADTDEFVNILMNQLPEGMFVSEDILRSYTDATVESDTRYLTTTVETEHPNKTELMARAMESAVLEFSKEQKELNSVKVVTMPLEAEEVYPDVRPVRAFILGAVIGLVAGIVSVCCYIICDSSVFLPNTMEKRYGVKALGCESFTESKNNICYAITGAKSVAIVGVGQLQTGEAKAAIQCIKGCIDDVCRIEFMEDDILSDEFNFDKLREEDKVILLIEAGAKNGKKIERSIEQIKRQDVSLAGAFLFGEDKKLIKQYYR